MEPPVEHACPSCAAPTQARQRWCLECGAELRGARRSGLRPAVGIATTLAVLVGAGSAAGFTLLKHDKAPPPPPTTVAQAPPATQTTPPAATQEPPTYAPAPTPAPTPLPSTSGTTRGTTTTSHLSSSSGSSSSSISGGAETGSGTKTGSGTGKGSGGSAADVPQLTLTDVALGAVAVVYAPYEAGDVDLGDASRVVDGTTRTAWKTPATADPAASPQAGVYVDLASRETVRKLVIRTPTPGMSVEIYGARKGPPPSITDAGWDHLASRANVPDGATIKLPARPVRYVLVWVTGLPPAGGRAAISELSLFSLQPE